MNTEAKEIIVGMVAVVVLATVILMSVGGGGVKAKAPVNDYFLNATFNRIDGLVEGDEVRLGGIKIGKVESAILDDKYRAKLKLRIKKGVELPTDTSVAIHTDGLFGPKYIVLEPGGEEAIFKDGDEAVFTQDAVIVSELLDLIISQGHAKRAAAKGDQ